MTRDGRLVGPRRGRTCSMSKRRSVGAVEARPVGVLADGTAYYAPIGELVHDGDAVVCHLCGRAMRMIGGTHLRVGHGWTLQQYREAFHLPMHAPTCSRELSNVYREQAVERVKATEHFGQPPTPRKGPTPARSPRWRSLAELHPELVAELSPRNEGVDAAELGAGSRLKPWWRCRSCGHEWRASVTNRTLRGSGCPRCAVRRRAELRSRVEPERSLAVARPDLVAELDPERNDHLNVTTLGVASMRKVWWRCGQCDHSWETTVASRAGGTGCPACWNRRRGATFSVVPPERSLAHRAPRSRTSCIRTGTRQNSIRARSGRGHPRRSGGCAAPAGTSGRRASPIARPAPAARCAHGISGGPRLPDRRPHVGAPRASPTAAKCHYRRRRCRTSRMRRS